MGRSIDLDSLSVSDNLRKNFLHIMSHEAKRINTHFIVSQNHIQMSQHTIILIMLYEIQKFLIISLVIFFLRPSLLKFLRPKALVLHLMHGQNNKIKGITLI